MESECDQLYLEEVRAKEDQNPLQILISTIRYNSFKGCVVTESLCPNKKECVVTESLCLI